MILYQDYSRSLWQGHGSWTIFAEKEGCTQVVILGAGYDTRWLHLGFIITTFEADQPEVHKLKMSKKKELFSFLSILTKKNLKSVKLDSIPNSR